ACLEIAEGRSVDLIEVDAASRTRVEDTRELLDNVQYMPTRCRYKVYLIDEVHMLSNHSFNALLKTLEEPPDHVKFLLATTDPKKLPVTVLSRCLQFNLKNLPPQRIVDYLKVILEREGVSFEEPALWQLGRAADGSMRDALSLTDQAVAFGHNTVTDMDVKAMLGSIDQQEVYQLLNTLINADGAGLLDRIEALSEFAPDYKSLLSEVLAVLHRVAVAQAVPEAIDNSQGDQELVMAVADSVSPEDVQLYYQIGLLGQRDLPYAPDQRSGFEMTMLRMLAFVPVETAEATPSDSGQDKSTSPVADILSKINGNSADTSSANKSGGKKESAKKPATEPEARPAVKRPECPKAEDPKAEDWVRILPDLELSGVTQTLAANCVVDSIDGKRCLLLLGESHASLWNKTHEERIARALSKYMGKEVSVTIEVAEINRETPAAAEERKNRERQQMAIQAIENDEKVQTLIEQFNGKLDTGSIAPRTGAGE
ncbi:MAG: DNA polymerase III subunit gamma/tau, partial [Pseudomonadales bacterium]